MNDTITTIVTNFSPEEIAIIDAAFKLHEIVITHRSYKRGRRGKHPFTRGAFEQAKKALTGLLPPAPGADPARIVALFAKDTDIAKAAIKAAIERLTESRQEEWDSIHRIELSDHDLKALSDDSPIFKRYRSVTILDRAITELSHPGTVSKTADAVWALANRVGQANRAVEIAA
ncbi:hypothetical protein JJB98_18650 [Bradyrhizobium diazoefficiens]|nr:hypothetical protein [Bradyrhizobium diazoefficiens]QQO21813.1 hypothetical protein JJB98_18650 [Bradyrhizobium diazoefficiens]